MALRALVTGAHGFVGGVLSPYLESCGWEVVRCGIGGGANQPDDITIDITDAAACDELFANAGGITHVFHLAAIAHLPSASQGPADAFRVNVLGTINLTESMKRHARDARFIHIGSAAAYGRPMAAPITEDHPLQPNAPYGISKAASEQYSAFLFNSGQANSVMLRPFNHSGPGQTAGFVLPSFARQLAEIERGLSDPIIKVGNLQAARDFLHVDDVAAAYEVVAREGRSGEAYNVCSGESHSIRAALDRLIELAEADVTVEIDEARLRPVDIENLVGSYAKLTGHTGWKPQRTFDDLLRDLLSYWRGQVATA